MVEMATPSRVVIGLDMFQSDRCCVIPGGGKNAMPCKDLLGKWTFVVVGYGVLDGQLVKDH